MLAFDQEADAEPSGWFRCPTDGRRPAPAAPPAPRPAPAEPGGLGPGERAVLTACAQHPGGCTREQLAVLTGYKRSSRDTYLQRLAARRLVTAAGRAGVRASGVLFDG